MPIWDCLPYSVDIPYYGQLNLTYIKNLLKNAFISMAAEQTNSIKQREVASSHEYHETFLVNSDNYQSQGARYTIQLTNNTFNNWLNNGYTKVRLKLKFKAREFHDGYQEFYLSTFDSATIFESYTNFEITPGKVNKIFTTYYLEFSNINISTLKESSITNNPTVYMYFSAHGNGSNNWEIKNLSIEYQLYN